MNAAVEVVGLIEPGYERAPVIDLVRAVLEAEHLSGAVAVAFLDEASICGLNARYRGLDEPTDVLSFRYADGDSTGDLAGDGSTTDALAPAGDEVLPDLGELAICPAVVGRYAKDEGRSPGEYLGWAIIHGVLHLAGYDHETDDGEMRRREQALLTELAPLVRAVRPPRPAAGPNAGVDRDSDQDGR